MRYQVKNNYVEVRSQIAKRVLGHPLAAFVGYPDNQDRLSLLNRMADGTAEYHGRTMLSLELRRAGTNVNLYIEADPTGGYRASYDQDAEGNDYTQLSFRAEVNWPCHGSVDAGTALARLHFYQEVALLAAELKAELEGQRVWYQVQTKQEREESEKRVAENKVKNAVVYALDQTKVNMRVNAVRNAPLEAVKDIPDGSYEHEFSDGKKFTLTVKTSDPGSPIEIRVGLVTRVS